MPVVGAVGALDLGGLPREPCLLRVEIRVRARARVRIKGQGQGQGQGQGYGQVRGEPCLLVRVRDLLYLGLGIG